MYKSFFGVKNDPFTKDIDSKNVFRSACFLELASRLEYMKANRGLMMITGEPGSGKTIGIRAFVESLNTSFYAVSYIPLSTVSTTEFYRQLNLKLTGEFRHRKVDLFNSIQKAIKELITNQKKVPVIIIDEAHLLKPENLYEIQIILNFDIDSTNPVIFIIAGQSHLRDKITRPVHLSLSQRFVLKYHTTPMDKTETKSYIQHRLELCGLKQNQNIFSDSAIEAIFQNTQGTARAIDNFAKNAMMFAASKKIHTITEEEIFAVSGEQ